MLIPGNLGSLLHTLVAGVGVDDLVIITHQVHGLVEIVDVRGRGAHGVDVPGTGINTDVGLEPEMPLTVQR